MTSKRRLAEDLELYRGEFGKLRDRNQKLLRESYRDYDEHLNLVTRVQEVEQMVAETHPYVYLAEDLLTLMPDLGIYVNDGVWDFAEVSRAAEHKRGKTALDQFETLVNGAAK